MKKDVFAVLVALFVVCTTYHGAVFVGASPSLAAAGVALVAVVFAGAFASAGVAAGATAFMVAFVTAATGALVFADAVVFAGAFAVMFVAAVTVVVVVVVVAQATDIRLRWYALLYVTEVVFIVAAMFAPHIGVLLASLVVFCGLSVLPKKALRVAKNESRQEEATTVS